MCSAAFLFSVRLLVRKIDKSICVSRERRRQVSKREKYKKKKISDRLVLMPDVNSSTMHRRSHLICMCL